MAGLTDALSSAGGALSAYQRLLGVVQQNITNSSTPGYAKQQGSLEALPLDFSSGLAGGVAVRDIVSARDEFAEQQVWSHSQVLGRYEAQTQALQSIETVFGTGVAGGSSTGVQADLNTLYAKFSAWSVTPSSPVARDAVIAAASQVAADTRSLSRSLQTVAGDTEKTIAGQLARVNQLASRIAEYNQSTRRGNPESAKDTAAYAAMEELSRLVDVNTIQESDGTINVLLEGGTPLVLGQQVYDVSQRQVASGNLLPDFQILSSEGKDITSALRGGSIGGLLDVRQRILPGILGDSTQAGTLNQFAAGLADSVNRVLTSGKQSSEPGAAAGVALFSYDTAEPTRAAYSLDLNPAIKAELLAPVDADGNSNGTALALASLGQSTSASSIGGETASAFFARIVADVGAESSSASANASAQQQVLVQAQGLRAQISGVSLDEQAIQLLQFQNAYQATARLISVINSLMQTTVNLGNTSGV